MAFENLKSTGIKYLLGKLKDYFLQIKDAVKTVNQTEPDENGDISITTVQNAENLVSDSTQVNIGTFTKRTSGGTASIESEGSAWLMNIKGNSIHEGFVPEVLTHQEPERLTVTIDRSIFTSYVTQSTTLTFNYTTEWSANLATYGITVTGTPESGDTITVTYVKEERGIIYQSAPTDFISTRWNLYSYDSDYFPVVKYSDDYGFRIEGTYTALQFSATGTGGWTALTINDGNFTIPSDGYLKVTGGNSSDTAVYMTWSDWTEEANGGTFNAHDETTIDLSSLFEGDAPLPYGLCKVGSVFDEVNFNLGTATRRVDRMEYSEENRQDAEESGREYEYDTDYIYIALAEPVTSTISIDGSFTADDHGMEIFSNTTAPVTASILYGNNLKNKLERDVVTKSQDIINGFTSTATDKALSAAAGKTLNDQIVTNDATTSVHGLMPATDKANINRMANGNSYVTGNADNYKDTGFYTVASAPTNIPEGYGVLLVFKTGDFVEQVYFRPSKMYARRFSSGSWSSWASVSLS